MGSFCSKHIKFLLHEVIMAFFQIILWNGAQPWIYLRQKDGIRTQFSDFVFQLKSCCNSIIKRNVFIYQSMWFCVVGFISLIVFRNCMTCTEKNIENNPLKAWIDSISQNFILLCFIVSRMRSIKVV